MKCPRCGSDHQFIDKRHGADGCVFCYGCNTWWTFCPQQRIEELEGLLREIAEHPHCRYENLECSQIDKCDSMDTRITYNVGTVDGHRCAAAIARRAFEEKENE
jgi:hypothetical protein